jgi:hypothetical protein
MIADLPPPRHDLPVAAARLPAGNLDRISAAILMFDLRFC